MPSGEIKSSDKFRAISFDEARAILQLEPQPLREAAIHSLREAQAQPHLPYDLFREIAVTPRQLDQLRRETRIALTKMLELAQARPFMSVCQDCGTVIGLHEVPAGESSHQFGRVLFLTAILEKMPCPSCGETNIAFLKSTALVSRWPLKRLMSPGLREPGEQDSGEQSKKWWQFWK